MSSISIPEFTVSELFEAGVHFGHNVSRRNPKMSPYIFSEKSGIHVIDLVKTHALMKIALSAIYKMSKHSKRILFVGTRPIYADIVADCAKRCGQHYVNYRWLGGMLTNWKTVSHSIKELDLLEKLLSDPSLLESYTKKEILGFERSKEKLLRNLGGVRKMRRSPDMIVALDVNKDSIAIQEAQKLRIPVVAILDTNSSPEGVRYPVPGNDDSIKAINCYLDLFAQSAIAGIESSLEEDTIDTRSEANFTKKRSHNYYKDKKGNIS